MQHISKGRILDANLTDLVEKTAACGASDSRDRVFALLGLISESSFLKPDYSLSASHVMIGVAAHCLLNEKSVNVLHWAAAATAEEDYPSWVPQWLGSCILDTQIKENCQWMEECIRLDWGQYQREHLSKLWGNGLFDLLGSFAESLGEEVGIGRVFYFIDHLSNLPNQDPIPWHRNATVDAHVSVLSINLTHLVTVTSRLQPFQVPEEKYTADLAIKTYRLEFGGLSSGPVPAMYIFTQNHEIEKILEPMDEIFVLFGRKSPPIYLFLRPGKTTGLPYRLVYCSSALIIVFHSPYREGVE